MVEILFEHMSSEHDQLVLFKFMFALQININMPTIYERVLEIDFACRKPL